MANSSPGLQPFERLSRRIPILALQRRFENAFCSLFLFQTTSFFFVANTGSAMWQDFNIICL